MKIGVYKDNLSAGRGADIAVRRFAEGMRRVGVDVELFDKSRFFEKAKDNYDVFVVTGTNEIVDLAGLYPKCFPWRVVMQLHTHPDAIFKPAFLKFKKWRFNRQLRLAMKRIDVLQVLKPSQIECARKVLGKGCPKTVAIGNPVPMADGDAPVEYGKTIVCPAALQPLKRQTLLIEAFSLMAERYPEWQLHLYGNGKPDYVEVLKKAIAKHSLEERVLIKGYADLAEVYRECGFVALASKSEGFGLVVAEAAVHGKPSVVCTPQMEDLVVDGVTGRITQADAESLATAFEEYMCNEAVLRRDGEHAREFAAEHWNEDKIFTQWLQVLSSI